MQQPRVWNKHNLDTPSDAVYIGRGSKWGNPWRVKDWGREGAILAYTHWLDGNGDCEAHVGRKPPDPEELQGKDLVCFCAPLPCHGDILLELANAPA